MTELVIRMEVPSTEIANKFKEKFLAVSHIHNAVSSTVLGHEVEDPSWGVFMDMMHSEQMRLERLAIILKSQVG